MRPAGSTSAAELADRLDEFRRERGSTYEAFAKRTGVGRSSLHRYCTGKQVPADFGTVERIAKVCGASRAELTVLYQLWSRAVADSSPDPDPSPAPDPSPEPLPGADPVREAPVVNPSRRRPRSRYVVALVALVLGLVPVARPPDVPPDSGTPDALVTSWAGDIRTVPAAFFGVTVNDGSGAMPGFPVGSVRLWDSGTRWASIETRRGQFAWGTLDKLVAGAGQAGLPVLFVLGSTPAWANPGAPVGPYADGSRTGPPLDLADYDAFVRAVVERYRSRIAAYQLWSIGDDPRYYSGDGATLVEMTRRAHEIIATADPRATTVCPSRAHLDDERGRAALLDFAARGGYQFCDVAAVNIATRSATDPPETALALTASIDRTFHQAGVHPPLWNTGTRYDIALERPLDPGTARAYAARFYLVGLYARYARLYLYAWGTAALPVSLQVEGSRPTPAAEAVAALQGWLVGSRVSSCGHGAAVDLPVHVWRCTFAAAGGSPFSVVWTDVGEAETATPFDVTVRALDGTTRDVAAGGVVAVGAEPLLVRPR